MQKLRVTGLNMDIVWKEKQANYVQIEKWLESEKADVFILPEMFSTGFCMDVNDIADKKNETLQWMLEFSKIKDAAIAGSVSVEDNGKFFNRFYFVKPDGTYELYNKRHLFSFSGEDKVYTKGDRRQIVNYKGVRIFLQVCYDLRFPVFSRNLNDYDLALYVANWPDARVEAWNHLLKARAIENQSYVFGLNRIGRDGNNLNYVESSHCFFSDGSEVSKTTGNIVSAEISLEKLSQFREKFQFLNDQDRFQIDL